MKNKKIKSIFLRIDPSNELNQIANEINFIKNEINPYNIKKNININIRKSMEKYLLVLIMSIFDQFIYKWILWNVKWNNENPTKKILVNYLENNIKNNSNYNEEKIKKILNLFTNNLSKKFKIFNYSKNITNRSNRKKKEIFKVLSEAIKNRNLAAHGGNTNFSWSDILEIEKNLYLIIKYFGRQNIIICLK
ncbi:HEPN domain-containing protein [Spiroplasma chrysopicola]|uniref:RiboL-PSP-HEPN domain-containing protein n=1 Tax=Spiroplasma chrysopicola DF-1 TaxID=1276227 RepID=R4UAB0_9MOLU|nr:HEPN domain-containing protein [Spiroplasma chrysopicola]AGM24844.1 hypothetical protein SCHRY_v1c02590 [Spiroplasma chrysopicola DF-1]